MRTLVIAEKPSVAKDIAQVLGKMKKIDDRYENEDFVVTSALGHLVELYMPEEIDRKLKRWDLKTLPILPNPFQIKASEKTKGRLTSLVKLLNSKDIGKIINACDSGREGELIFTYIYDYAKCKKDYARLWMVSMTPEGIRQAFEHLRSAEEMRPLQAAARCRAEADWLIGINGTRAITLRMSGAGAVSSVGRVQTPTLAMIVDRDRTIRNFVAVPYWRIAATFAVKNGSYSAILWRKKNEDRFDLEADAQAIVTALADEKFGAVEDVKKRIRQSPPRLFDLTALQKEANVRFHFSAAQTLKIAQALYETHKAITYPRTDSKCLPEDYGPVCRSTLESFQDQYAPLAKKILDEYPIAEDNRKIFNNGEVSDHFAIIPTPKPPKNLGEGEGKIYDLIVRRFLSVFYPAAEYDVTTRTTRMAAGNFHSEGKVLAAAGWLEVFERSAADGKGMLPALSEEDGNPPRAELLKVDLLAEKTRPPAHYTEATLLSAMEMAGRLVEENELAEAMKEKGLGTPATRAQIIDNLIQCRYVSREDRSLLATQKAEYLLDFLTVLDLKTLNNPMLTGEWEFKLREIEHQNFSRERFMEEIENLARSMIDRIKNFDETDSNHVKESTIISPLDGKPLIETFRNYMTADKTVSIGKIIGGRELSPEEVRGLLKDGRIGPFSDFKSRAGKSFTGSIILDNGRAKIEFDNNSEEALEKVRNAFATADRTQVVGKCPVCGAPVMATAIGFLCENLEQDKCKFRLSSHILSRNLEESEVIDLLNNGETAVLDGFVSNRTGKSFSAKLLLSRAGKISFAFPPREKKPAATTPA